MKSSSANSKLFNELFETLTQVVIQNRSLDDLGLTRLQAMALRNVNKQPGITMTQLAAMIGITNSQLTRIINTLEEHGLVLRERNQANRRLVNVQRTKKGTAVVQKHLELMEARVEEQLETLDALDQEALIHHLQESIRLMEKGGIIHANAGD